MAVAERSADADGLAESIAESALGRRASMKMLLLGGLVGGYRLSSEGATAQTTDPIDEVENLCLYQGPLENGTPPIEAEKGCAYCYIEYTDSGGPGALWISTRDMADWELLHSTTQELRLEDHTDGSADEVGIVQEDGKLFKVTYQ